MCGALPGGYTLTAAVLIWYNGFLASLKLNFATMSPLSLRRFSAFLMVLGENDTFSTISFRVLGWPSRSSENTAFADDGRQSTVIPVISSFTSHIQARPSF